MPGRAPARPARSGRRKPPRWPRARGRRRAPASGRRAPGSRRRRCRPRPGRTAPARSPRLPRRAPATCAAVTSSLRTTSTCAPAARSRSHQVVGERVVVVDDEHDRRTRAAAACGATATGMEDDPVPVRIVGLCRTAIANGRGQPDCRSRRPPARRAAVRRRSPAARRGSRWSRTPRSAASRSASDSGAAATAMPSDRAAASTRARITPAGSGRPLPGSADAACHARTRSPGRSPARCRRRR